MQPLRGFDSLSLGDLLQGITLGPLSPPNMPGAWDGSSPDSSSMMAGPPDSMPPWQRGLTRESLTALKAAMARIAPHVPPDLLQQHYIRRIAELSNPTPETLYPALSYDTAQSSGNSVLGGNRPAPLSPPPMPAAMDSPYRAAVMDRFGAPADPDRHVQPVRSDDAPFPIGDVTTGVRPAPHSSPNIPSVNDQTDTRYWDNSPATTRQSTDSIDEQASWKNLVPVWGPGQAGINDFQNGHYLSGARKLITSAEDLGLYPFRALQEVAIKAHAVPVLSPATDAYEEAKKGDYGSALADGALALADAVTDGAVTSASRGVKAGSQTWAAVRPHLGKLWNLPPRTHVHHAFFPQKNKSIPESVRNHPLNLKPMYGGKVGDRTTQELHNAVHGIGKKRFFPENPTIDYVLRAYHGWPNWSKVALPAAAASTVGNFVDLLRMQANDIAAHPDQYREPILPP